MHKIINQINNLPSNAILIQWIPSHSGIYGNDQADHLAKTSLNLNFITKVPISTIDAINMVHNYYHDKFTKVCNPCPHTNSISIKTTRTLPDFLFTSRSIQTLLSRLHLRVTYPTHHHILTKTAPRKCLHCNTELSLIHIFLECPHHGLN